MFRNYASIYGNELLAPRPTSNLEVRPLSYVGGCLFNIFAATLHIGGRSSIRILRTCHTVVTAIELCAGYILQFPEFIQNIINEN